MVSSSFNPSTSALLGQSCAARRRHMISLQRRFSSVSSGHVLPLSFGGSRPRAEFYFTNMQQHKPSRRLQGHESVIAASAADIEQHQLQRQSQQHLRSTMRSLSATNALCTFQQLPAISGNLAALLQHHNSMSSTSTLQFNSSNLSAQQLVCAV